MMLVGTADGSGDVMVWRPERRQKPRRRVTINDLQYIFE